MLVLEYSLKSQYYFALWLSVDGDYVYTESDHANYVPTLAFVEWMLKLDLPDDVWHLGDVLRQLRPKN